MLLYFGTIRGSENVVILAAARLKSLRKKGTRCPLTASVRPPTLCVCHHDLGPSGASEWYIADMVIRDFSVNLWLGHFLITFLP